MCGPIAFILPVDRSSNVSKVFGLTAYNLGRTFTYAILGLVVGVFGEGLRFAGVSQTISIVLGVLLLLTVLVSKKIFNVSFLGKYFLRITNFVKNKLGATLKKKSTSALFVTGLLNGLIPCGAVFIALQAALLQPSVHQSVAFMFAYGLGTIPMMFSISYLSSSITGAVKKKVTKIMPIITVVVALLLIVRGLNLDIPYISPAYHAETNEMSCCHKPQ